MKITNCKINTEQKKVELEASFLNDLFEFKKEFPLPNMNDIEGMDKLISLLKDVIEYYECEKTKNLSSLKIPCDMFDNILKGRGCIETTYPPVRIHATYPPVIPSNVCIECYQVNTGGETYCYICKKKK